MYKRQIHNNEAPKSATNIGSGKGTTLFDLAKRVQLLFESSSEVIVLPPRSVEVVKFVADIKRMSDIFTITVDDDPLKYLGEMVEKYKI